MFLSIGLPRWIGAEKIVERIEPLAASGGRFTSAFFQ
jgi:hypothetical protein